MNYLNPLRLHFAGRFQASPSTVNNDPLHYDNDRFKAVFQERSTGPSPDQQNGWWNPGGDAAWRFLGCRVTSAWRGDGSPASKDDPIFQCLIADSDRKVAAKIVDLDPEQQLVSEIWGLEVRICDSGGRNLLRARFEPAAFMDIWDRSAGGGGDTGAGAMYQSVLSEIRWEDVGSSPFLEELRKTAATGLLSIKFNVDGYNMDYHSPDFTRGRVVGTIGPTRPGEPRHFVRGRQFMTTGSTQSFFAPTGKLNFCAAVVNQEARKIYLDLGNAIPTTKPGGDTVNLGALSLACITSDGNNTTAIPIGDVPYTEAGWYERTAGVIELPAGRRLSDDEIAAVVKNPLALLLTPAGGTPAPAIMEAPGGLFLCADQYVYRLDPGETAGITLFATRYGSAYGGARVLAFLDPTGLQQQRFSFLGVAPPVATPAEAIAFPARVVTDGEGKAVLSISARDPGSPRGFLDGQVYGVRPALEETLVPAMNYPFNPWSFISLLVHSPFEKGDGLTWYGSIRPILQQYANLYPVMSQLLDLADYDAVCANRRLLLLVFGLEPTDPNFMPVTRDLSKAKRRAVVEWLSEEVPPKGEAPPKAVAATEAGEAPHRTPDEALPQLGGKAAAASQRLGLRLPWRRS